MTIENNTISKGKGCFLQKLSQILDDPKNGKFIAFDKKRGKLIIPNIQQFEHILAQHFDHSNFTSFSRQLYWFGFRKVKDSYYCEYRNPELAKGKTLMELKSRREYKPKGQGDADVRQELQKKGKEDKIFQEKKSSLNNGMQEINIQNENSDKKGPLPVCGQVEGMPCMWLYYVPLYF